MKYKTFITLLAVLALVLITDALSKTWAESRLHLHQPVDVLGDFFRLTLGYNTGVAFGMFADAGMWPLLITGSVIGGLIIWLSYQLFSGAWASYTALPIGLLLGGAIGNFADRLPDQRVTDFLDVGVGAWRWPTFNLADSYILIGLTLLMLMTYQPESTSESNASPTQAPLDNNSSQDFNRL